MYISSFIVVWLWAIVAEFGLAANVPARRERHELTISECAARGGECDETKGRPVCGTDDQTYPSRCHLLRAQCSGYQVSLKYRGHCKACKDARDYALKHRSHGPPKFIPRCKSDGTYAAVQCLGDMGCWCSDITGKPIENTSVRNGKPKCREYTKANIRRSPSRHVSPSRLRRTCTAVDRAAFNANLIKVFQSEFMRAGGGQQKRGPQSGNAAGALGAGESQNDRAVLDWKFTYLDVNANQMLDKNEFRELKKLVKRAVKPRRCGRAFGKFCDLDDDDRLTLTEWNDCFSKDQINRPKILTDSPNPKIDTPLNNSENEFDCLADQKIAIEEQRGGTLFYVPECTPDGRYQRIQCYRSTPYCWCVHEDTGKNIPGTTMKDRRPQCDITYVAPRPMKGCPEPRKAVFLNDLKEFLKTHIVASAGSGGNTTKWTSEDERIATLSFVLLDKNKNKSWERKEWKTFREMVTSSKTLRKCGKKMPRYCDVNGDKKITLTEWLNCLQAQRIEMQTTVQSSTEANISMTSKPLKLTGFNPLEQYLKE